MWDHRPAIKSPLPQVKIAAQRSGNKKPSDIATSLWGYASFGFFLRKAFCEAQQMADFSRKFLQETVEFWRPVYDRPLTLEEAREIAENLTSLFKLLADLDNKYES